MNSGRLISDTLGEGVFAIKGDRSTFTPKDRPNGLYVSGGLVTGCFEQIEGETYSEEFLTWVEDYFVKTFQARHQGLPVWFFGQSWKTESLLRRLDDPVLPVR